jgi:chromatin modification-related protein VID21
MDADDEATHRGLSHYRNARSRSHEDEIESDDILGLVPNPPPIAVPSRYPSRTQSQSTPVVPYLPDDDDERDELDLIGSLSPSPSPPSRTRSALPSDAIDVDNVKIVASVGVKEGERHGQIEEAVEEEEEEEESDEEGEDEGEDEGTEEEGRDDHEVNMKTVDEAEPAADATQMRGSPEADIGFSMPLDTDRPVQQDVVMMEPPIKDSLQHAAQEDVQMTAEEVTRPSFEPILNLARPSRESPEDSHIPTYPTTLRNDTPVSIVTPSMPLRVRPPIIPAPPSPLIAIPPYLFESAPVETENRSPESPPSTSKITPYSPAYKLPPLKSLPVIFHRKSKSGKQRKRDKEKEREKGSDKNDTKKENKDECAPMGLNKWGATVRTNPVHRRVARATKCLSTRDWNVRDSVTICVSTDLMAHR